MFVDFRHDVDDVAGQVMRTVMVIAAPVRIDIYLVVVAPDNVCTIKRAAMPALRLF
jgi:hypothetical protein